jgi:hypothetical protein
MSEAPYPPADPADGDWNSQPPAGNPRYSASASVPVPPAREPNPAWSSENAHSGPSHGAPSHGASSHGAPSHAGPSGAFGQVYGGPSSQPAPEWGAPASAPPPLPNPLPNPPMSPMGSMGSMGQPPGGQSMGQAPSGGTLGQAPAPRASASASVPAFSSSPSSPPPAPAPYGPPPQQQSFSNQPGVYGTPGGGGQTYGQPPAQNYGQPAGGGQYGGGQYGSSSAPAPYQQTFGQPEPRRDAMSQPSGGWPSVEPTQKAPGPRRGLIIVLITLAILVVVGVGGYVGWSLTMRGDAYKAGSCVKQDGTGAAIVDCGTSGAFKITSIQDTEGACPDPGQPSLELTEAGGAKKYACLAPATP